MRLRHGWRRIALTATVASLAVFVAACSGTGQNGSPSAGGDTAKPVAGGSVTIDTNADPGCVDPAQTQLLFVRGISRNFADTLTFLDSKSGVVTPWLAKSWDVNKDASSYTFHLRDDVTFSDGTKLTAEVVKENLDALVAMGARAILAAKYLAGYKDAKVVDAHTLTVDFDHPNAPFLQAVSTPAMGIFAKSTTEKTGDERCAGQLVGSGPFTLDSFKTGVSIVLSKRDGYHWGPAAVKNTGAAYIDNLTFKIVPDASVRAGEVQSGQSDGALELLDQDVTQLRASNFLIGARANPGLPNSFLVNITHAPLTDVAVRQAMQIGIDRAQLVAVTLAKTDKAAKGPLSATTPGFVDLGNLLAYNEKGAEKILDKAGWKVGSDGIRVKDGKKLSIRVMYFTPNYLHSVPTIELAAQQLKKIGIDLVLDPVPVAEGQQRQAQGNYDLILTAGTRADPNVLSDFFSGMSPELDSLLTAQRAESDPAKRLAIVRKISTIIIQQGFSIPLHDLTLPFAYSPKLHGVTVDAENAILFSQVWKSK